MKFGPLNWRRLEVDRPSPFRHGLRYYLFLESLLTAASGAEDQRNFPANPRGNGWVWSYFASPIGPSSQVGFPLGTWSQHQTEFIKAFYQTYDWCSVDSSWISDNFKDSEKSSWLESSSVVSSLGTNFSSGTKTILKVGEDEEHCINKVPYGNL